MKLKALIQKEFQRFFRDPKLIVTLVLPGILIYFIYSLMGGLIWDGEKDYSYDVLVYGSSPAVEALFEGSLGDSLTLTRTEDKENAKAQVKAGSVTALVVFSDDFDNAVSTFLSGIGDWVAAIPVLGTVVAVQRVLEGGAALLVGLIAIGINLVFTALLILLTAKMLGSERIMFGK